MDHLIEVMARLRSPEGCPWDREQDHHSLKRYAIEEAYELLEAIDQAMASGDDQPLIEELGDVLLQVLFHAQIASEEGRFHFGDVVDTLREKLIRRHPHVFQNPSPSIDTETVIQRWEEIKKEEKGTDRREETSLLDDIPQGLPALSLAKKVQSRAAQVGFEWKEVEGALAKVAEEIDEVVAVYRSDHEEKNRRLEEELGDLLFSIVNVARYIDVDPESALFGATQRFKSRFRYIEQEAQRRGQKPESMELAEMDALWDEAKRQKEE